MTSNETKNSKVPVYTVRLDHIRCAVWENERQSQNAGNGESPVWHNIQVVRRYRDANEWHESTNFRGLSDIALVREALELARQFICRREEELRATSTEEF